MGEASVREAPGQGGQFFIESARLELLRIGDGAQLERPPLQLLALFSFAAPCGLFDQANANQRCDAQILDLDAPCKIMAPGKEMIHPSADRVAIATYGCCAKTAAPAIIAQR